MKLARRSLLTSLFSLPLLKGLPVARTYWASLTDAHIMALPTTPVELTAWDGWSDWQPRDIDVLDAATGKVVRRTTLFVSEAHPPTSDAGHVVSETRIYWDDEDSPDPIS